MNRRRSSANGERGATLLLVVLGLVAFLGIAALAIDLGMGYAAKRTMSNAADAAALAGAQEAGARFVELGGCTEALKAAASGKANDYHNLNNQKGSITTDVTCDQAGLAAKTIDVTAVEEREIETIFGRVLGVNSLTPGARATARVFGTTNPTGLRPFVVCLEDAKKGLANPNVTYQSIFAQENADLPEVSQCNPTGAPGNWGLSRFDFKNPNNNLLECLVQFGYGGGPNCLDANPPGINVGDLDTVPPLDVCPDTANSAGTCGDNGANWDKNGDAQLLKALIGKQILVPVGENWSPDSKGSNAHYVGRGALYVTVCGFVDKWHDGDDSSSKGACWDKAKFDALSADTVKKSILILQWRYAGTWVTSYFGQNSSTSGQCEMGDFTCPYAIQLLK